MTQLTVGSALNIQYAYPATQNNGKVTSQTDVISGEQVTYTYDSLNRLATAQTADNPSVTQWGQSYTYDGFGNLTDQNVIKGSAPTMHVVYNAATNRQTGDVADANGNIGSGSVYDIENRLLQAGGTTMKYAYNPGNKRIWRGDGQSVDEIAFWGSGGRMAAYQISLSSPTVYFMLKTTNVSFGGKLVSKGTSPGWNGCGECVTLAPIAQDRLGSIGKYYPYGQERPSATANDTEKFTGYFRDAATGLDYADQRYHQPGVGRFMTPDSAASAKSNDPGSSNKYAYAGGDPVNRTDRAGQDWDDFWDIGFFDPFDFLGGAAGSTQASDALADMWYNNALYYLDNGICPTDLGGNAFFSQVGLSWATLGPSCDPPPIQTVVNVPCDPGWLPDSAVLTGGNKGPFTGADVNYAARVIFGESSHSLPEDAAIADVIYNRIKNPGFARGRLTTLSAVVDARTPRGGKEFDAVGDPQFNKTGPGQYQNLTVIECAALSNAIAAMSSDVNNGAGSNYIFFQKAPGPGTQIGGTVFR